MSSRCFLDRYTADPERRISMPVWLLYSSLIWRIGPETDGLGEDGAEVRVRKSNLKL